MTVALVPLLVTLAMQPPAVPCGLWVPSDSSVVMVPPCLPLAVEDADAANHGQILRYRRSTLHIRITIDVCGTGYHPCAYGIDAKTERNLSYCGQPTVRRRKSSAAGGWYLLASADASATLVALALGGDSVIVAQLSDGGGSGR